MKNTIQDYTEYLFCSDFTDDTFDPEDHEEHLKKSWELFDRFSWNDIYPIWMEYLHTQCKTIDSVINFANLFVYYEAAALPLPDPIDFISYLYYRVDMNRYWDVAGDLFDSIAISILSKSGLIDPMKDPYYSPLNDTRILSGIQQWSNAEI